MADAAAAPAGAPAPSGDSTTPANTNTETSKAKGSAPNGAPKGAVADAGSAWGDNDDAELVERLKRSPYKLKVKGAEQAIDSKEALKAFINDAQRGKGATKVVEDAKREAAEAKAMREEVAKERELLKRAKAGDWEARKELGLLDPREVKARQDEWESVPPEVRELYEDRQRLAKEADELRAEKQQREQEAQAKREEVELQAARRTAVNETHKVLKALGVTEGNAERLMPHVAGAIADLHEIGLELGVDMSEELILERVKQRIGGFDEEHFSGLAPDKALAVIAKQIDGLDDAGLLKALPEKFAQRVSRAYARQISARRAAGTASPVRAANDDAEKPKEAPRVLSFGKRW